MFGKKSTGTEPAVWDSHTLAVLDRIETRLDRLGQKVDDLSMRVDRLQRDAMAPAVSTRVESPVREWLPVLDRMHEIALVAMGHPDLAQSFGLTSRQKESAPQAATVWATPPDEVEGIEYS
jgi:hypothetical protein